MKTIEQIITEYVEQFEKKWEGDFKYIRRLEEMRNIELKNINEQNIVRIIQGFLNEWGNMKNDRRIGGKKYWQQEIAKQIFKNNEILESFRKKTIQDTSLGMFEQNIGQCFQSLNRYIGKIATGKVLHIICPNFFPLWDNPIANAIKNEGLFKYKQTRMTEKINKKPINEMTIEEKAEAYYVYEDRKQETIRNKSSEEYYIFMKIMQSFINNHITILINLATKYEKSILKITDECFWWGTTHRPLFLFFNSQFCEN